MGLITDQWMSEVADPNQQPEEDRRGGRAASSGRLESLAPAPHLLRAGPRQKAQRWTPSRRHARLKAVTDTPTAAAAAGSGWPRRESRMDGVMTTAAFGAPLATPLGLTMIR